MSLKSKIESVLFLTDKPIRAQAIAKIVNEDVQVVRQAILELIADYEGRDTGLEIGQDNGYIIQVKDEHASIIEEFAPTDISAALLRTLSAIAIKQPVMQSEIIRIRGAGAYEHVKLLLERELINKEDTGRSPILTTTKKFQEYFRLTKDANDLRKTIKKQDKPQGVPDDGTGESGDGEADTATQLVMALQDSDAQAAEQLTAALLAGVSEFADAEPVAAASEASDQLANQSEVSETELSASTETSLEVSETENSETAESVFDTVPEVMFKEPEELADDESESVQVEETRQATEAVESNSDSTEETESDKSDKQSIASPELEMSFEPEGRNILAQETTGGESLT
jgi:segregation and condensation protein B